MQLYSYENISLQGVPDKNAADVDFAHITAQGPVYPLIRLVLKARSSLSRNPQNQYSVQPNRIFCELFIEQERSDTLIAIGEAEQPLSEWQANYDQQVVVRFPLSERAVQYIAESLRGDYMKAILNISGSATYQIDNRVFPFQFQKTRLEISLSKTDWIKKVLEPIGWGIYYMIDFPAPPLPSDADFTRVLEEIQKATDLFLAGHDGSVFLHAYHAWDSLFYSKRDEILPKVSQGDQNKQGAIEDLIKAVHRFSNGGRHLPEDRPKTGGFEVDHADAEYVRGLVALSVAYLAKRLQIQKLLSSG